MKYLYASETEIPAELKKYYKKQDDGTWVLDCEGAVPVQKLNEFRTNNKTLFDEKAALEARFKDVDPDEFRKLKARAELVEDGKVIAADKVEAKITERTTAMKTQHDKELQAEKDARKAAEDRVASYEIDGALREAGKALGIRDTAETDLILRGRSVFAMVNGKVVAKKADGAEWFSAKNGEALTPKEWVEANLLKEAPHLFAENNGSGAGGSGGKGSGSSGPNPWKPETKNITKQMQVEKEDPGLAARLKTEAGVK
jgi:hypothetical protein